MPFNILDIFISEKMCVYVIYLEQIFTPEKSELSS